MTITGSNKFSVSPGQLLYPEALRRLVESYAPTDAGGADSAALYLTPAALVAWFAWPDSGPNAGDAGLRDWRQFLSQAEQAPGGAALRQSDTGLVALRTGDKGLVIIPPFPITDALAGAGRRDGWDAAPLGQLLATDYTVGVILLRLGRYLVAVFEGDRPVVTKTDTRYVKGKHHAGGTSQLRFQRIREGQMRKLYDETCQVVRSRFAPHAGELDYILLGGDRLTLSGFMKVCPYLQQHQDQVLNRRLNLRDPKHDTLETVAGMLRQSRVWSVG